MSKKPKTEVTLQEKVTKSNNQNTYQETITKKPYVPPQLKHEGKWDTVTMQFGGSFAAP